MLSYEEILERALLAAAAEIDLEMVAEEAGEEPLTEEDGAPVEINETLTLEAGGFMTTDRGIVLRLSDGSQFTVEIKRYR
ncbi:hypothetical protein AB0N38_30215 [Micromonospora aurantiaca]|uniref:hypothetical protein n=1 Tax=Micromonospora TaxID=1873 RepID=UPI001E4EDF50|nr:hypothetical protein [Micromonospora aurantiaca]MCY9555739.1 hypothetical protein [Paenibacillus apiarius]UFN92417.1 hypothetical protein LF814_20665 [Micromonospora aurantiaca]